MYELAIFSLSLTMGFFYGFAFKDLKDDHKKDKFLKKIINGENPRYSKCEYCSCQGHTHINDNYIQIEDKVFLKQDLLEAWHNQLANDEIKYAKSHPKHIRDTFAEEIQPEELSEHSWEGYSEWLDQEAPTYMDNNHDPRRD